MSVNLVLTGLYLIKSFPKGNLTLGNFISWLLIPPRVYSRISVCNGGKGGWVQFKFEKYIYFYFGVNDFKSIRYLLLFKNSTFWKICLQNSPRPTGWRVRQSTYFTIGSVVTLQCVRDGSVVKVSVCSAISRILGSRCLTFKSLLISF